MNTKRRRSAKRINNGNEEQKWKEKKKKWSIYRNECRSRKRARAPNENSASSSQCAQNAESKEKENEEEGKKIAAMAYTDSQESIINSSAFKAHQKKNFLFFWRSTCPNARFVRHTEKHIQRTATAHSCQLHMQFDRSLNSMLCRHTAYSLSKLIFFRKTRLTMEKCTENNGRKKEKNRNKNEKRKKNNMRKINLLLLSFIWAVSAQIRND